jgi:hypothetical protein
MATVRLSGSALAAALLLAPACRPSCEQVCEKLLDCDAVESPRVSLSECEDSCSREETLYETWDDQQLLDALYEEMECVADSSCDEVAGGACYDDALFVF